MTRSAGRQTCNHFRWYLLGFWMGVRPPREKDVRHSSLLRPKGPSTSIPIVNDVIRACSTGVTSRMRNV